MSDDGLSAGEFWAKYPFLLEILARPEHTPVRSIVSQLVEQGRGSQVWEILLAENGAPITELFNVHVVEENVDPKVRGGGRLADPRQTKPQPPPSPQAGGLVNEWEDEKEENKNQGAPTPLGGLMYGLEDDSEEGEEPGEGGEHRRVAMVDATHGERGEIHPLSRLMTREQAIPKFSGEASHFAMFKFTFERHMNFVEQNIGKGRKLRQDEIMLLLEIDFARKS
jgi:hypothetical protein